MCVGAVRERREGRAGRARLRARATVDTSRPIPGASDGRTQAPDASGRRRCSEALNAHRASTRSSLVLCLVTERSVRVRRSRARFAKAARTCVVSENWDKC